MGKKTKKQRLKYITNIQGAKMYKLDNRVTVGFSRHTEGSREILVLSVRAEPQDTDFDFLLNHFVYDKSLPIEANKDGQLHPDLCDAAHPIYYYFQEREIKM